jgi:hypothetical protein
MDYFNDPDLPRPFGVNKGNWIPNILFTEEPSSKPNGLQYELIKRCHPSEELFNTDAHCNPDKLKKWIECNLPVGYPIPPVNDLLLYHDDNRIKEEDKKKPKLIKILEYANKVGIFGLEPKYATVDNLANIHVYPRYSRKVRDNETEYFYCVEFDVKYVRPKAHTNDYAKVFSGKKCFLTLITATDGSPKVSGFSGKTHEFEGKDESALLKALQIFIGDSSITPKKGETLDDALKNLELFSPTDKKQGGRKKTALSAMSVDDSHLYHKTIERFMFKGKNRIIWKKSTRKNSASFIQIKGKFCNIKSL